MHDKGAQRNGLDELRDRLVSRIEREARAFVNADPSTKLVRYGRVLGLLEVGVKAGLVAEASRSGCRDDA